MKEIRLDDLPQFSPWIERILGLVPWTKPSRDLAKVEAEYDRDKYAKLLDHYSHHAGITAMDIHRLNQPEGEACISQNERLFLATPLEREGIEDGILLQALAKPLEGVQTIVELGAGYGYNLAVLTRHHPALTYLGGEYSRNAVELASRLFETQKNISVAPFNFYDGKWNILEDIDQPMIVFTKHAIEQIPTVSKVLETLLKHRDYIADVIHLEPVYELHPNTILGQLRRAYTQINDYNVDLLTVLGALNVTIKNTQYDLYGRNPLNPTSLIHWQP